MDCTLRYKMRIICDTSGFWFFESIALVTAFKGFNLGMCISLDHVSSSTGEVMQRAQSDAPDPTWICTAEEKRDGVEESRAYVLVRKATFWCSRV